MSASHPRSNLPALVATLCAMLTIANAVARGQTTQPAERNEAATQIGMWIEQLEESSITKRRHAKEELIKAGSAAIPFLAQAALSEKRDLIVYSLEVLGVLAEKGPDEETRQAARITLETLAESEKPSTAERAKKTLESQAGNGIEAFPGWDDPNSQFAGGGAVNRSVSVSSINGVKTIRIEEDGRITVFRDEPRGAIRVSIKNGDETKEFVAQDLAELKAKDEVAHALYMQHSNGVGGGGAFGNFAGGLQKFGNFGNKVVQRGGVLRNNQGGVAFGNGQVQNLNNGVGVPGNAVNANALMIQQLEELKRRLADHPEMTRILDEQIQTLKQQ